MSTMEKFRPPLTGSGRQSSTVVKTMEGLQQLAEQQMKQKEKNLLHIQELKQRVSVLQQTQNVLTAQAQVKQRDIGCLTASRQALREHSADVDAIYKLIAANRAEADKRNAENHDVLAVSQELAQVLEKAMNDALTTFAAHETAKKQMEGRILSLERVVGERKEDLGQLLREDTRINALSKAAQEKLSTIQEGLCKLSAELQELDVSVERSRLGREAGQVTKDKAALQRAQAAQRLATVRHEAAAFSAAARASEATDASSIAALEAELAATLQERALAVGEVQSYEAEAENAAVAAQVEEEHAAAAADRASAVQAALKTAQDHLSRLLCSRADAESKLNDSTSAMLQYSELSTQASALKAKIAQVKDQEATVTAQIEASRSSSAVHHRKIAVCRVLVNGYGRAVGDLCNAVLATTSGAAEHTLQEGSRKMQHLVSTFTSGLPPSLSGDPGTTAVIRSFEDVSSTLQSWAKEAHALEKKAKEVAAEQGKDSTSLVATLRALASPLASVSSSGSQYMTELGMSRQVEAAMAAVHKAMRQAVDKEAVQGKIAKATDLLQQAQSKHAALETTAAAAEAAAGAAYARAQQDKACVMAINTALAAFEGTLAAKSEAKMQRLRSDVLAELRALHERVGSLHGRAVATLTEAAAEAGIQVLVHAGASKQPSAQAGVKRGSAHMKAGATQSGTRDSTGSTSDEDEMASVRVSVQGSKGRQGHIEKRSSTSSLAPAPTTGAKAREEAKQDNGDDDDDDDIMAMMAPTKAMPPPHLPFVRVAPVAHGQARTVAQMLPPPPQQTVHRGTGGNGTKAPAPSAPRTENANDDALSLAGSEASVGSSLFGDVALGQSAPPHPGPGTGRGRGTGSMSQASDISALYVPQATVRAAHSVGPVIKAQRVSFATSVPTARSSHSPRGRGGNTRKVARGGPTGGGDEEEEEDDDDHAEGGFMGPPPPPVPYARPTPTAGHAPKPVHKAVGLAGTAARPGLLSAPRGLSLGHAMFAGGMDGPGPSGKSPLPLVPGYGQGNKAMPMPVPVVKAVQPAAVPAPRPAPVQPVPVPVRAASGAASPYMQQPQRAGVGMPIAGLTKAKPVNMFDAW